MKCVFLTCACVGMACCLHAAVFTIRDGVSDWASESSYVENDGVPQAGDTVDLPANTSVTVDSSDAASCKIVSELGNIRPYGSYHSVITFNVREGDTLTLTGTIWRVTDGGGLGKIVKDGLGTLVFDSDGEALKGTDYYTSYLEIKQGTLVAPQHYTYKSGTWGASYGNVTISNNATFKLPYGVSSSKHLTFMGLYGDGLLTVDSVDGSAMTEVRLDYSEARNTPCEFGGAFDQYVRIFTERPLLLTGTNSTGAAKVYNGNGGWSGRGMIGARTFGKRADASSSLGTYAQIYYDSANGGTYKYLGTGETTDKLVSFGNFTGSSMAVLDGGAFGGLTLTSTFTPANTATYAHHFRFGLSGDNAEPCVIKGGVSESSVNGTSYTVAFQKRGSGAWRFADCTATGGNTARKMHGAFAVDEGVLQFDSLVPQGEYCSLGTSTNRFVPMSVDNTKITPVDWAFSLGTTNEQGVAASEGGLEYTGTQNISAETRPVKMYGSGKLLNSTAARVRYLLMPPEATGAKTLTLGGTGTAENEVSDITDDEENPVSVAKGGSGTWVLGGDLSFHGNLTVTGGTLIVRNYGTKYTWYKFTVKDMFADEASPDSNDGRILLHYLGLFDADGNVQNTNIVAAVGGASASLDPGEADYGTTRKVETASAAYGSSSLANLFNPASGSKVNLIAQAYDALGTAVSVPRMANRWSWVPMVIRLPQAAQEVASFDLVHRYGSGEGNLFRWVPKRWSLEGSVDGLHWENAKTDGGDFTVNTTDYPALNSNYLFIYSGYSFQPSVTKKSTQSPWCHEGGCAIRGSSTQTNAFLDNVGQVAVSGGSHLKAEGATATIKSLRVVSSDVGDSVIEGFAFSNADTCSIDIVGKVSGSGLALPVRVVDCTGLESLSGWKVSVNGMARDMKRVVVRDGRLCVQPMGFVVIVR